MATAVFVGHARARTGTVTQELYGVIAVVVEIDTETGTVVAGDINLSSPVSRAFISRMLVGRNLLGDMDSIISDIEQRYHSTSKKAVIQALQDLFQRCMSDGGDVLAHPSGEVGG